MASTVGAWGFRVETCAVPLPDDRVGNDSVSQMQGSAIPQVPDSGRVRELAHEAVRTLRSTHEHLQGQAQELDAQRQRLSEEREEITQQELDLDRRRKEFENELAEVVKMSADLERRTTDMEASKKQLQDDHRLLAQRQEECQSLGLKLKDQEHKQKALTHSFAEREEALVQARRELESKTRELEPQRQALERREQELAARCQAVNAQTLELDQTREMLAVMQAQLEQDNHALSAQRDELLHKLSTVARPTPPSEAFMVQAEKSVAAHPPRGPKPAVADAIDQFRKLRRDAKRKAIGV